MSKWFHTSEKSRLVHIVFFLALVVRLFHIIEISQTRPYYQELRLDASAYDRWGRDIADGNIVGDGVFYQDPLYPYFLGLIYSIFGHKLFTVVLIQGIIGALTASLIFLIGRNLFNGYVGLIASLLWIFHQPIIFYEGLIQKEGLAVFLTVLAIYMLVVARESRHFRHLYFGGFFIGLSALTRGNMLLVIPFIFLWLAFECRKDFLYFSLVFFIGLLSVLMPVAIRNKIAGGEFVLTTSQGGSGFYWGNNEKATGSFLPIPEFVVADPLMEQMDFAREAMRLTGRKMTNSEVSRFWFKKGIDFIREHPYRYLLLQYHKTRLLFNKAEISDNYQYYYLKRFSTVLQYSPVSFWMIASLGLLGMALCIQNWRKLFLLYLFIISYSLSLILFFVMSRYRLPITPILTIFAAYALDWIWKKIRTRNYQSLMSSAVLLLLFAFFVGTDINWVYAQNRFEVLYNEAVDFQKAGKYEDAIKKYKESLKIGAFSSYASHMGLGDIYMKEKIFNEAISEYKIASTYKPRFPIIYFKLGNAYTQLNNLDEAIQNFKKSIELYPDLLPSYYALAVVYEKKGMINEAFKYQKEYRMRARLQIDK